MASRPAATSASRPAPAPLRSQFSALRGWRAAVIASNTPASCGAMIPVPAGEQLAGAAAQAAPGAAAFLVELVFGPAVRAGVRDREPGAVRAGVSGRAGRGDQPALLAAALRTGPGGAARRCSTGRRPAPRASGQPAGGPGRSGRRPHVARGEHDGQTGRLVGGEVARPAPAADAAGGHAAAGSSSRRYPGGRHGPRSRDRGGLPAPAALAVPPRIVPAAADLADRPASTVPASGRA